MTATATPWTLLHDDRAFLGWIAALVDTCGTIRPAEDTGQVSIRVDHRDPALIARVAEIAEVGIIGTQEDGTTFWQATGDQASLVLSLIAPSMVIQRRAACEAMYS